MINLLPQADLQQINNEYKIRHRIIVLVGSIFMIILVIILMIPMYVLTYYRSKSIIASGTVSSHTQMVQNDFQQKLADAKILVQVLKIDAPKVMPTAIISLLEQDKTPEIKITGVTYAITDAGDVTIAVQGIAKNRLALSTYTDKMTHEPLIKTLDIPVSNFAKDTDISFTFTMVANTPKR